MPYQPNGRRLLTRPSPNAIGRVGNAIVQAGAKSAYTYFKATAREPVNPVYNRLNYVPAAPGAVSEKAGNCPEPC